MKNAAPAHDRTADAAVSVADETLVPPIEHGLREVAALFELAAAGGPDVLPTVVTALRAFLRAGHLPAAAAPPSSQTVDRLVDAMHRAGDAAIDACGGQSPADQIPFGFSAAMGVAMLFRIPPAEVAGRIDPERAAEAVDLVALTADELDALHRRRRIAARGDVLRRAMLFAQAAEAPAGNAGVQVH